MDLTPLRCLINSISRFVHLVTCRVSNTMPAEKDYVSIVSILKQLKPVLDDVADHEASHDDEALSKECEELDVAVNEAREFLEKWSPRTSKILCVLQSKPLILKIQLSSVKLSRLLCRRFESQSCSHNSPNLKVGHLCEHIEDILKCQKDGKAPDGQHLTEIVESLNLSSSQELLNEYIALEKEKQKSEANELKENLDQISQTLALMSHIRDHVIKLEKFKSPNGITVPSYFRCPLSLELMWDPVIVASGQTYERASVQKWLDHGLERCPKTGYKLSHKNLTPNYTVKALITNWCNENNANIEMGRSHSGPIEAGSSPEHSYVHSRSESASSAVSSIDYIPAPENIENSFRAEPGYDKLTTSPHVEKLVDGLKSASHVKQTYAAGELRFLAKHNMQNRVIIGECGAVGPLIGLLRSSVELTQEHAVTALLNLSIDDRIKAQIAEQGALEPLIHVLRTGNPGARENAAAAIFSISLLDEQRVKIGRSGAVKALVDLLGTGTVRGKKDAATALFNLSIFHENKARIVQAGAVRHLVGFVDPAGEMVDKAVALLANLSTITEGCSAIAKEGAIPLLVEVLDSGSQRGKENAASILLQLCINSEKYCRSVLQEGAVPPLVALSQSGTPRAREKVCSSTITM
ncbi:U-box domain-containing protein 3 [Phtheirospermum japonicum]|uniref:RING-type E3 ubiquitin transferase n=1 Tax=Phtheirospermum japonicum TaxID=374723 RepID=A0A830B7D6_9LAMI|nr:U-box domain-containing protein 3 [Phtheirospermum japonicum]